MKHILLFMLLTAGTLVMAQTPEAPQVKTVNGTLEGMMDGSDLRIFRGIPYALPPVGRLRWCEPQPAASWTGVRKADKFGNRAMQPAIWNDMLFRSEKMSEDCLYLNVWTPANASKLPVLVYFHGGGLVAGDGSELRYDGSVFARKGIVVVSINYRLGVFGYFSHPELTRESPHHASGNYGYLDQMAALKWVHENIVAFGGDPEKVTIGGQSAGAFSVSAQMASPLAKGLFQGAIAQSGSLLGCGKLDSLATAEQNGVKFAESLGSKTLAELRMVSAEKILKATSQDVFGMTKSIVDGYFLPDQPEEIFFTGRQSDVVLLAGWTSAEVDYHSVMGNLPPTPENYIKQVTERYPKLAKEILRQYPGTNQEQVLRSATDLGSDRFLAYRTWKLVEAHYKSGGKPVYRYLWDQIPPMEKDAPKPSPGTPPRQGAGHSSDLPYAFGTLNLITAIEWTPQDHLASDVLVGFLANFIKNGTPNGAGLPEWPWYQAGTSKVMVIDSKPHTINAPNQHRYEFWDANGL